VANLKHAWSRRVQREYTRGGRHCPTLITLTVLLQECPSAIGRPTVYNQHPLHTCQPFCWVRMRITCIHQNEERRAQDAWSAPHPDNWDDAPAASLFSFIAVPFRNIGTLSFGPIVFRLSEPLSSRWVRLALYPPSTTILHVESRSCSSFSPRLRSYPEASRDIFRERSSV
jgi:hypothetical protein